MLTRQVCKEFLRQGLVEDGWPWDWTTLGIVNQRGNRPVKARIVAKSEGVWAGEKFVEAVNELSVEMGSAPIRAKSLFKDGAWFKPKSVIAEWNGPAREVLAFERPFLNLVSYVSGIATRTSRFTSIVEQAWKKKYGTKSKGAPPRVTSTRKTLPLYKDLAVYGVIQGGGFSHRLNLASGILIKENHIAAAGSVANAIEYVRAHAPHGLKIEIEVTSLKELEQALQAGAEGVLLDNFKPSDVRRALSRVSAEMNAPFVEVSGGLSEDSLADYVIEGVHVLSIGGLTHSVKSVDLSLLMT